MFTLPGCLGSVADARRRTRDRLHLWGFAGEICDLTVLVVSELVTNAVRHTASRAVVCQVRSTGSLVHVEVQDEGAAKRRPRKLTPGVESEGGRGLLLVDTLTESWGVRSSAPGTGGGPGRTVWATLRSVV